MSRFTDEVIAKIDPYTIYAEVEYERGEEPHILKVHVEPMPSVDDVQFTRDILVPEGFTMDMLIMEYLPQCKICNVWLDEAIKEQA